MSKEQPMKPLKELNLTNRFLFAQVMEDAQTQEDVLSIILGREIHLLHPGQTEKEQRVSPLAKSIRMDVFSMDEDQTVYNTEMQNKKTADLAKRSRYYQSLMDTSLLKPGDVNYNLLNDSYLIMIMTQRILRETRWNPNIIIMSSQSCRKFIQQTMPLLLNLTSCRRR